MRRIAIIFTVISVAVLILGLVEQLTNFRWAAGDQNPLYGSNYLLRDGTTALILGGFLTLGSILMWLFIGRRKGGEDQRQS